MGTTQPTRRWMQPGWTFFGLILLCWALSAQAQTSDPYVASNPMSRTNAAGTSAAFGVSAGGTGPFGYQWYKDGLQLTNPLTGSQTSQLSLTNVLHTNEGGYFVVITNSFGSATSQVATLTVKDPFISNQPASQSTNLGQSASFTVTIVGTPTFSYQWRRNGTNLPGQTASSLVLTNVQTVDAGKLYSVIITNSFGSVTSAVVGLTVNLATIDAFNPNVDYDVYATAVQPNGQVLIGGGFQYMGSPLQPRNGFGRVQADGTLDTNFNPGASPNLVSSFAMQSDGKTLIGGSFTTLGGQARSRIARLNTDGTVDNDFNPGCDSSVACLAIQTDGKILIGGAFSTLAGQPRSYLGRLNADGTLDATFNPGANSFIQTWAIQADGKILVGGSFTNLAGQARAYIGRLNVDGTLDTSFNPQFDDAVFALQVQADGKILVGGRFTRLEGLTRIAVARLNLDGTVDSTFNPGITTGGIVESMAIQADGKIVIAPVTRISSQPRKGIARVNPDGTLDFSFDPGDHCIGLALQVDGKILVSGLFSTFAGQPRNRVARLNALEPATQALTSEGSTITWWRGGSSPEVWRTTFEASTNGIDWASLGAGTRITGGWQLTNASLVSVSALRARGFLSGGNRNTSSWYVETVSPRLLNYGIRSNQFGFNFGGRTGQTVVLEGSTDVSNWTALATNTIGTNPVYFAAPDTTNFPRRFYRARAP